MEGERQVLLDAFRNLCASTNLLVWERLVPKECTCDTCETLNELLQIYHQRLAQPRGEPQFKKSKSIRRD